MDADGDFIVAWQSFGQDGSGEGVYAQRYGTTFSEFSATSSDDTLLLRRNGSNFEMFHQNPPIGAPDISQTLTDMTSLTLQLLGGNDTVIIDFSGGNPIPPGGLIANGGADNDTLAFQGNSPAAILLQPDGSLMIGGLPVTLTDIETIDLTTNSAILHATPETRDAQLATLTSQIASARNTDPNALWTGPGLTSSTAAANPDHTTTLAILLNDKGDNTPIYQTFANQPVGPSDILIKYTWTGDADLTGKIDANDYFKIDHGFANHDTGYNNGDFDYSGTIDANDYFLIDKSFAQQSTPLAANQPAPLQLIKPIPKHKQRKPHHPHPH
jgi:hypothetical protein